MHCVDLYPHLGLGDENARQAAAYARVEGDVGVLGNGLLEIRIDFGGQRLESGVVLDKTSGETSRFEFNAFEAWFDFGKVSREDARLGRVEPRGSAVVSSLTAHASCDWFDVQLFYVLHRGQHFLRKCIVFHNLKKRALLHKVSAVCRRKVPRDCQIIIHDGGMYFPIVFIRGEKTSIFYCGDFPGYFVSMHDRAFSFDYYPGEQLQPGRSYQSLMVHIGLCALTGRFRSNPYHERGAELDVGEQRWFRDQLLLGSHAQRLPFLELEAPGQGIIGVCELELLQQCQWFGARHVYMPRILPSPEAYPLGEAVKAGLKQRGVNALLVLSRDKPPNLHWVALAPDGSPAGPDFGACFACEGFRDSLIDDHLNMMERHGFGNVEVRGAPIVACHSTAHGHAPGVESIQKAFRGLVEVAEAMKENCGHVRCGAPYGSYGAGLTRLFDAIPILVEEHPLPLPDIHVGRLFADMGRLYFRRSHDFLLPKSKLPNSVGLVPESCPDAPYAGAEHYPWDLYHDSAGWRYGLISALATGLRHRFHALPQDLSEGDRAFAEKWLAWEKEHLEELMEVEEILDEPGLGPVDGYSYTGPRSAIVFLFNTSYDCQEVLLRLHLAHDSDYVVRELYPREMNYLGPNDGLFRRDSEVVLTLDPKEARIIEAVRRSPASAKRKRPEVFGAIGHEKRGKLVLRGRSGADIEVGVRTQGAFLRQKVRFPGPRCARHLRQWAYIQCSFEDGIAVLPKGDFAGKRCSPSIKARRNVWLSCRVAVPKECEPHADVSPFKLHRPCWSYPERLFFVVRFEPPAAFDPIRTSARVPGIPEAYLTALPMKCGIDLTPFNLGLKAWVNGEEREVYPALAAWKGFMPNPYPTVAYFFEAGSKLKFGSETRVVLFASHFDPAAFRGIFVEHFPDLMVEKALDLR